MPAPTTEATTVAAFVADRCIIGLSRMSGWSALYTAWTIYSLEHGAPYLGTFEAFELALHRAVGALHVITDPDGEGWDYLGVALRA